MNPHHIKLFKAIAILLPFLLIGLLEVSLRLFHYGYDVSLFTEYPRSEKFLMFNPHASKQYFPNPEFASIGNQELFAKKKGEHTFRVFVLGESTTIGYPYFHNGSFHRWLLFRLMHTYPDKNFEIINLSLTAVNSYTVRGFAKELVSYQPDAVFIYSGQNEYYGALGVASSQSIGGSPSVVNALLSLRQLRTVQMLALVYYKIAAIGHKEDKPDATRMELMAGKQEVAYQSDLYYKGIYQFRVNMEATLSVLQQHDIPVFISNLVSNVKDIPPFINDTTDYYGKRQFFEAKEHDKLRFRAPEAMNLVIDSLCRVYSNAYLVDSYERFSQNSEDRLLGNNLFTDHVHPNLKGYYLMSNAFYDALQKSGLLPSASGHEMTEAQLAAEMPLSVIDSLAGELRIQNLKGRWPFNDARYKNFVVPAGNPIDAMAAALFRKQAGWLEVQNQLYMYYVRQNQPEKAARIAEGVMLEYPEDPVFYQKAAQVYGQLGNKEKAMFYLRKYVMLAPTFNKVYE